MKTTMTWTQVMFDILPLNCDSRFRRETSSGHVSKRKRNLYIQGFLFVFVRILILSSSLINLNICIVYVSSIFTMYTRMSRVEISKGAF